MAKRSCVVHVYIDWCHCQPYLAISSLNESPGMVLNYDVYDLTRLQKILVAHTSMYIYSILRVELNYLDIVSNSQLYPTR